MVLGFNRRILNFLMSGRPFDDPKKTHKTKSIKSQANKSKQDNNTQGNVYQTKMDYVSKVAEFLEDGVREMKKDIKKL